MSSPYASLADRAFWRTGVVGRRLGEAGDVYRPKFAVSRETRILTAGSCFAQHVGRALRGAGYSVIDVEPAPPGLPEAVSQRFGYGLYSARYANIYTARQLRQLLQEAAGQVTPADPVWQRGDRFHDAQRPGVEPEGLDSADLVLAHRRAHLAAVNRALDVADMVVFTLGLTEAWTDRDGGTVYPTAPGTIAGQHDPSRHVFVNDDYPRVLADLMAARDLVRARRPEARFMLTVSPVPLTATMSGQHVEVATAQSKAVLRAVAGKMAATFEDVDYFPSYEIITSQSAGGAYFADNLRSVTPQGVRTAMTAFLAAHGAAEAPASHATAAKAGIDADGDDENDLVCEEALLDAMRR